MKPPQTKTKPPNGHNDYAAPATTLAQHAAHTERDPRWQMVVDKDASADGSFYYSVRMTGVYCKPSCASRLARPENVQFHATVVAAEAAGFRACKRCKPDEAGLPEQRAALIASICRQIELAETAMPLSALAQMAGMSSYHFHRVFKAVTGLTPHAYTAAFTAKRMRNELGRNHKQAPSKASSITQAVYAAGYSTSSRFYAHSKQILGMTPSDYRAGGSNTDIKFAIGQCRLGSILVASSALGVCAIYLGEHPEQLLHDLQDSFPAANLIGADRAYDALVAQVVGHIQGPAAGMAHFFQHLPLDIRGTVFQLRVWRALRDIPAGATVSYTEIAQSIGCPKAVRAVAGACAANKLAIAIPCHRVVRNDGALAGYRWGVQRKRALLDMEKP